MANYGYYYVVCLRNTGSKRKVLAHGMQRIDLDWCNSRGYDPAEEAMTDFWDSTEIPYSRGWRDYMWDQLERYVYLSDETDYKNRSWMPETDREILLWVDLHGDEVILDEDYIKNKYEIWEWVDDKGKLSSLNEYKEYEEMWSTPKKVEEAIVPSHCRFNFSKEDLDLALDAISDDSELGLELGYNSEDRINVTSVAGEPYCSTAWYVDKWADNCYFVRTEYIGQDGGGPEEGKEYEFESIDELWDFLSVREQMDDIPNLRAKKEWVTRSGQKVNLNNAPSNAAPANYPSQEKRYKSLLAQIDHDNICTYTVQELTDRILDLTLTTKLKKDISIKIIFKPYVPSYLMQVAGRSVNFDSYAEILDLFEVAQIIKDRSLCEWIDSKGNKVATSSTKGPSNKTRAKAQTLFGDADDYHEEFNKLYSHILTVNQPPANTKDERITPVCLRAYWINNQGKECRLEVTTTKIQNFKLHEQFDYVLSYFDPNEKIISRGLIPSYDELLNVLLKYKVITDKTKCQV